jgi:hypothetical protein
VTLDMALLVETGSFRAVVFDQPERIPPIVHGGLMAETRFLLNDVSR